jgi:hypothetical protein
VASFRDFILFLVLTLGLVQVDAEDRELTHIVELRGIYIDMDI